MSLSDLVFLGLVGISIALPTNISFVKQDVYGIYDNSADWRIVGGSTASSGQFPYIASLRRATTGSHFCGGAIVSSVYIISAAHCVFGTAASSVYIVVGTNTLNSGGTSYAINRIVTHANYSSSTGENDISLLRTTYNIALDGTLVSSVLISSNNVGAGVTTTLSGWGTLINGGSIPNSLQYIQLQTINNTACANAHYPNPTFYSQICTYTRYGEGACHGDSGGPLVWNKLFVGVVSWGQPCGVGYPDVFTRISSFINFIQDNTI